MTDIRDEVAAALDDILVDLGWEAREKDDPTIIPEKFPGALATRGLTVVRAPRADTRLVEVMIDAATVFGTRTEDGLRLSYAWGEPDRGVYELVLTASDDGFTVVRKGELDALIRASRLLDSMDGQADHPGRDRFVKVTVETWVALRPVIRAARDAAARLTRQPEGQ